MHDRAEVRAALVIARAILHAHPLDIEAAAAIVRRLGELAPAVTSTMGAIEGARAHESLSYAAMARFSLSRLVMSLERELLRSPP